MLDAVYSSKVYVFDLNITSPETVTKTLYEDFEQGLSVITNRSHHIVFYAM